MRASEELEQALGEIEEIEEIFVPSRFKLGAHFMVKGKGAQI